MSGPRIFTDKSIKIEADIDYKHLVNENNIPITGLKETKCVAATLCCCVLMACVTVAAICQLTLPNSTFAKTVAVILQRYPQDTLSVLPDLTKQDNTDTTEHHINEMTHNKVVSCYYNFPSKDSKQLKDLMPLDIHPKLCTHINVAFARVVNKEVYLEEHEYKILQDIVQLRRKNPNLKILLSIGGAGQNNGFSDMVVDHQSRKTFIRSIKSILRNYTLDGIDLDWEFPVFHNVGKGGRERQHFSQLLREIRMEYIREKRDYLLTAATAAPETIVSISYDIDQLNQYLDFVNIMTYDFHSFTKYTPFTGLNSPLYPRSGELLYLATLNINYTIHMYLDKGLDRNKIVVGIPTYGHTFTLFNADNPGIGSPASSFGSLGSLGFVDYPDVCIFQKSFNNNVTIKRDEEAKVPYMFRDKEWVSYDSPESVMEKAKFIKDNNLRGAMIYSLNADDFQGRCAPAPRAPLPAAFPLARSVRDALL